MKVMLVHHAYPPEGLGGSEIYTESLARRLARDHEVTVLYRSADPARGDYEVVESRRDWVRILSVNTPRWSGAGFRPMVASVTSTSWRPKPRASSIE